jgi:hypothetical protein
LPNEPCSSFAGKRRPERAPLSRVNTLSRHFAEKDANLMATKLTPTEARQGTGPRAMFWVLTISITLAVIAGLLLGLGWISLPWTGAS